MSGNVVLMYSLEDRVIHKLSVKCPRSGMIQQVGSIHSIYDETKDNLSVFGYVRYQWKLANLEEDFIFPPLMVIQIMMKYYRNECIHLFEARGHHWKIDVFDLI